MILQEFRKTCPNEIVDDFDPHYISLVQRFFCIKEGLLSAERNKNSRLQFFVWLKEEEEGKKVFELHIFSETTNRTIGSLQSLLKSTEKKLQFPLEFVTFEDTEPFHE